MKSDLSKFFCFMVGAFHVLRNFCLCQGHEHIFLQNLLYKFCLIIHVFRSIIHLKLIFVYGMRYGSEMGLKIHLFCVDIQNVILCGYPECYSIIYYKGHHFHIAMMHIFLEREWPYMCGFTS